VPNNDWEWAVVQNISKRTERVCIMRAIEYESTLPGMVEAPDAVQKPRRKALTLNISSGGMLLLMDREPHVLQVLKVDVPTTLLPPALVPTKVPTLAEVAWRRPVPMGASDLHFVGLRFLF
jgi:hypothetical protein